MKRILIFLTGILLYLPSYGGSPDYHIYGRVTTIENKTYSGYLKWSNRQIFWTDCLQGTKLNNPYGKYIPKEEGVLFRNASGQMLRTPPVHLFACRFGNINTIRPLEKDRLELGIKGGNYIQLQAGNYSDIGLPIELHRQNDILVFPWNRISMIEFCNPEVSAPPQVPICAIVKSSQGYFKGFISIIHSESLRRDIRNKVETRKYPGYTPHAVPPERVFIQKTREDFKDFAWNVMDVNMTEAGEIKKIVRKKEGYVLYYNNNVSLILDNKRVPNLLGSVLEVQMPNIGSVTIPFRSIEEIEIIPLEQVKYKTYEDFPVPERINGEVKVTDGPVYKGVIIYDLDESFNIELLDGKNHSFEYKIPFRYIHKIEPKNYSFSFVSLKNGNSLSVGQTHDTSKDNNGILVFTENAGIVYIAWDKIESITISN